MGVEGFCPCSHVFFSQYILAMNRLDLNDLLAFAERNHLMDMRFQDVYMQYNKALQETYEDAINSMIDSSMSQHDIDFSEAV